MKKLLLTIMTVLTMGVTATAQNIADLVGTYKGDLYIQLIDPINEETEALPNQSIKIEAGEGKSINFALYNFAFGEMQLGDIVLNNVGVVANQNVVKFEDETPANLSFLGGAIKATAKINPTTSQIEGNKITANLDVMWLQTETIQVPIYVRFIGTKEVPAGIEGTEMNHNAPQTIYTLNGVRVNQTLNQLPKGIYIVNGKKIMK